MPSVCFNRERRPRAVLFISAVSLLLVLAACGGQAPVVISRSEKTPRGKLPPTTSLPLPPTAKAGGELNAQNFTLLDDRPAKLSDYAGQVLVLDFWATYCPPCLEEAPHLDALQRKFGAQGLTVLGLNVGGPEDRPKIAEFAERLKIKYTLGIPDPEMSNFYMGGDSRIPQTIVFDRTGRVVKHFVGYDPALSAELERTIQQAVMSDE